MFSKEKIKEALELRKRPSEHLRIKRILFQTRRPFTEMLETYRSLYAPTDRDNDPLFIHRLLDLGIQHYAEHEWVQDCPWEVEREEPLSSYYPLNLSLPQFNMIESVGFEEGWTLQRSTAAIVYTGLLLTYPDWAVGEKVQIQIIEYPDVPYQPNEDYLIYQGQVGIIGKKSNLRTCWESVKFDTKRESVAMRKDWLYLPS